MIDSHVISVNPGMKSLGELHNPEAAGLLSNLCRMETRHRRESAHRSGSWFYSRQDARRPAVSILLFRILMGATCVAPIILGVTPTFAIALIAAAALLLTGTLTRVTSIISLALTLTSIFPMFSTSESHLALCIGAVSTVTGILLCLTGSGRISIDALVWRMIKR